MFVGVPWNHGKHDLEPDGEALPAVTMEPREIEDAKMQDNACLDVDIGESDTETRKKRRITFKERPTHEERTTSAAREHSHPENLELVELRSSAKWRWCFQGSEFLGRGVKRIRRSSSPRK